MARAAFEVSLPLVTVLLRLEKEKFSPIVCDRIWRQWSSYWI
jgi:hypothetical protein